MFSRRRERNGAAAVVVGVLHGSQFSGSYLESQWKFRVLVIRGNVCLMFMDIFEDSLLASGLTRASVLCK